MASRRVTRCANDSVDERLAFADEMARLIRGAAFIGGVSVKPAGIAAADFDGGFGRFNDPPQEAFHRVTSEGDSIVGCKLICAWVTVPIVGFSAVFTSSAMEIPRIAAAIFSLRCCSESRAMCRFFMPV